MSFLAPYVLWGALAAGIPIALHFFYRSRHRDVPWGAMKFLLAAIEQTSRRLRFQELLLLVLRVCLLLLLAFALARPSTSSTVQGGQGDAVDAVLILDTSMSMDALAGVAPVGGTDSFAESLRRFARADGTVRCFDRARAAATSIVNSLPPHSTVQIIASSDRATLLGPRSPSHLDEARSLIEQTELSDLNTDFLPAFQLAAELLQSGTAPNKEVYLLTDAQREGFERRSSSLREVVDDLRTRAGIYFVHCPPSTIRNVAVVGITPQSSLRTGERGDFAVLVRNTTDERLSNLTITLEIDETANLRETQAIPELRPRETRAINLGVPIEAPGRHVLTARVQGDDLAADNRYDQIINVTDRVGILVVDGAPDARDPRRSASYYLRHALDPTSAEAKLPVTVVAAGRAAPSDLGGKEVCLLVNARLEASARESGDVLSSDFVRSLEGFVREGKSLIVFAGDRVDPEPYNRILFEQLRLLPYRIEKVESTPQDRPFLVDRQSAASDPYQRFREQSGYAGIDRIEVRRLLALDVSSEEAKSLADESRTLMRYAGDRLAVASRQRPEQGEVLLFTTSINDPNWSDWFISPGFVPFIQVTLGYLLEGQPRTFNRVAGETINWQVTAGDAERAFDLIAPQGQRQRLGYPVSVSGRSMVTTKAISRAGLYRLAAVGAKLTDEPTFAVIPELSETAELQRLSPEQINQMLKFSASHLDVGNDGADLAGAERLKREWTPWLLGLLLVGVLVEMVFAWYCGRTW